MNNRLAQPKTFYLTPSAVQAILHYARAHGIERERNGRMEPNLSAAREQIAAELREAKPHAST